MVEVEVKVCNFCKTPFKEGRLAPPPKKSFTPPQVVITPHKVGPLIPGSETKEPLSAIGINSDTEFINPNDFSSKENNQANVESIITRVKPANLTELYENIRNPSDNSLEKNLDTLGFNEEELDFKELKKRVPQSAIVNEIANEIQANNPLKSVEPFVNENSAPTQGSLIKDRIKRYSEKLVIEEPFARVSFEIDALELSEIKDAPQVEVYAPVKADSVDVAPEKLKDINDLARIMSPEQEQIIVVGEGLRPSPPTETDENKKFDNKNILRISNNKIIEQTEPEPPSKNIRNVIEALESVQEQDSGEIPTETVSEPSANETVVHTEGFHPTGIPQRSNFVESESLPYQKLSDFTQESFTEINSQPIKLETTDLSSFHDGTSYPGVSTGSEIDKLEEIKHKTYDEAERNHAVKDRLRRYSKRIDFDEPFTKEQFEIDTPELSEDKEKSTTESDFPNIESRELEPVIDGIIIDQEKSGLTFSEFSLKNLTVDQKENKSDIVSGQKSTNNPEAMEYYNKAKDYCVKGNYQKALEELETAVKIDPAFEQAHILLSRTYLKLKNM